MDEYDTNCYSVNLLFLLMCNEIASRDKEPSIEVKLVRSMTVSVALDIGMKNHTQGQIQKWTEKVKS